MPIHEILKPVSWLIGKWKSTSAHGKYPTIKPFEYCEELEFSSLGTPYLVYSSKTWHPVKNNPLHLESGFLRVKPGTTEVSLVVSHNFGLTSLEEGTVTGDKLKLKSTQICRMKFAKEPAVKGIDREFSWDGTKLECVVCMETANTEMTEHLRVLYERIV